MGLLTEADESKLLIKQVIQAAVADYNSVTVNELVQEMNDNKDNLDDSQKLELFVDRYDLRNWFYESMIMNDINIVEELNGIWAHKRENEREADAEYRLQEADRQRNGS